MLKKEILRAFNRMAKHCDCKPVVSRRVVQKECVVTHEPVVSVDPVVVVHEQVYVEPVVVVMGEE